MLWSDLKVNISELFADIRVWTWINDLLMYAMWFLVLNGTLRSRFGKGLTWLLEIAVCIIDTSIARSLPFMSPIRMLLPFAIYLVFFLFLFTDSKPKILFFLLLLFVFNVLNEMIGAGTYFPPEALAGTPELLSFKGKLLYYGTYTISGAILYYLLYLFLNRFRYSLSILDYLLFVLFPFSQFLMMYGWVETLRVYDGDGRTAYFLFAMVACVAADIGVFQVVRHTAQRTQLAAENDQLALQLKAQEKHYTDLTAQYEGIRRMRHDIANHLNVMQSLLENGQNGEAAAYISELTAQPYDATLGLCEHPVVDAFLHSKITSAKAAGIEIHCQVSLRAGLPISNVDLIRAFGNLLDNACEACSGIPGASVRLKCAESHGLLIIITENPVPEAPLEKQGRIPGLERGVGTRVLTDLAQKYDGNLKQEEQTGQYRTELILRMGANEE